MTKYLTAAAIVALTVPAFAQATFYIVQDTTTKRCQIVKERPTTKTMVIVGDFWKGLHHRSRSSGSDAHCESVRDQINRRSQVLQMTRMQVRGFFNFSIFHAVYTLLARVVGHATLLNASLW